MKDKWDDTAVVSKRACARVDLLSDICWGFGRWIFGALHMSLLQDSNSPSRFPSELQTRQQMHFTFPPLSPHSPLCLDLSTVLSTFPSQTFCMWINRSTAELTYSLILHIPPLFSLGTVASPFSRDVVENQYSSTHSVDELFDS